MTLTRFPDWQVRFEAFMRERAAMPFAWGRNDCALFAADAVLALTGVDVVPAGLRGKGARAAWRIVRDHGGMQALASEVMGDPVPLLTARIGDVMLLALPRRQALGICNGQTVLGPGPAGVVAMPMAHALACWRVG